MQYINVANQGVKSLSPYQAGKPIEELERELGITDIVKLASNENPFGFPESAVKNPFKSCPQFLAGISFATALIAFVTKG